MPPTKKPGGRAVGHELDRVGLLWLHGFRWLRPRELGALLWPEQPTYPKSGERRLRIWRERHWVIERELPDGLGTAILLGERGVEALADLTQGRVRTRSGKDWGEQVKREDRTGAVRWVWEPPRVWRHELLQASLAAWLRRNYPTWVLYPERLLRRPNSDDRVPDLLVIADDYPGGARTFWCEVENARKSGQLMHTMARTLIDVATRGRTIRGLRATHAMLAFVVEQRDERGNRLRHGSRVRAAIQAHAEADVPIMVAPLEVNDATGATEVIRAGWGMTKLPADAEVRELKALHWETCDDGWRRAEWRYGVVLEVTRADDGDGWVWRAVWRDRSREHRGERELDGGRAPTRDEARAAAFKAGRSKVPLTAIAPE